MRLWNKQVTMCLFVLLLPSILIAATYYVDDDGPNDPGPFDPNVSDPLMDGSFDHPFDNIQEGIDAATHGDTVTVMGGTYYEHIAFYTITDPNDPVVGKNIILTSTDPENPDTVASTIIDGGGGSGKSVVTFAGDETSACILKGFTVTHGHAWAIGGGMRGSGTAATITHCTITGNTADYDGGGLYDCDGTITHCTIMGNTAYYAGGLYSCDGEIVNCTITGNTAGYHGGGLHDCDGTITNCTITGNTADWGGGGGLHDCDGTITNCTITGNTAYYGGGLYDCDGDITNCTITVNTASRYDGGGLYYCDGPITNCTITGNTAGDNGGGLYSCHGPITNCIIWDNDAGDQGDQLYSSSTPTFSCIQDWTEDGTGNITSDPMFVDTSAADPVNWDLHLSIGSPCMDTGTNTPPGGLPATDIEGFLRPFDGDLDGTPVADMGAYEFHANFEQPCLVVTPRTHQFSVFESGSNPANQTLTVKNYGNQTLNWSIVDANEMTFSPPDWLTVTPTGGSLELGESDNVILSVDITGLPGGLYSYSFDVVDPAAENSPQTVTVGLEVTGAILKVSSNTFAFTALEAGTNPTDQTLTVSNPGGGTVNWALDLTNIPDWLTMTPTSGSLDFNESESVTLSVDITGLPGGQYSYSFDVIDPAAENSPQTVTVYLGIGAIYSVPNDYPTIQTAINAAVAGDTIVVLPGTYYENIIFDGNDVTLTSVDPSDPNIVANTIIDARQSGRPVTFSGNETSECKLSGFTITNGYLPSFFAFLFSGWEVDELINRGGGIRGYGTLATISECVIYNNHTEHCSIETSSSGWAEIHVGLGGGIAECDGIITNCIIKDNTVEGNGGGLYDCHGTITHCTITGNTADWGGGGGLHDCDGTITNCTITGNTADYDGGGLSDCGGTIINCTITDNTAYTDRYDSNEYGGGLYDCDGTITNCTITGNTAVYNGGGLYDCDGTITHCTITGNTAYYRGGGLYGCDGPITHCTIAGNTADDRGGLAFCDSPITHCIIWGNSAGNAGDLLYISSAPTYSCIQDWTGGGVGNITSDPLFADPNSGDYHLKSQYGRWDAMTDPDNPRWVYDDVTSPCIDAADPDDLDWQNELWPHGGRINMGAYGGTAAASLSANPVGNVADLDHDDAVGAADLSLFIDDWLLVENFLDTDLTRDGRVDIEDFAEMAYQWLWEQGAILLLPETVFSPHAFEGGPNPDPNLLTISNPGVKTLNWTIDGTGFPGWLTITPTSGALAGGETEDVTLSVDLNGLSAGEYSYTFEVSDPAADNSPQSVTVNLEVIGPILEVSETVFSPVAYEGGPNPDPNILTISNSGGGTMNWSIDNADKPDWLTMTPTSGDLARGETEDVTLSVDLTGLFAGEYSYTFEVSDPAADNSPQSVTVNLEVIGPILEVSETVFSFVVYEGGPNPDPNILTISNFGGGTMNWSINDINKPDWLTMTPAGGALAHGETEDVTLSVDITGLSGGHYLYTFEVSDPAADNSPQTINVELNITAENPVAHWKLDGDATDQTGHHDGTLHDGGVSPDWVAGYDGQALKFDGTDDYIQANSVCSAVAGSDMTVAAWVRAHTNNSNHQIVWAFNTAIGANRIILGQRVSNPNLLIHLDGDWRDSGQVVYDNTWHHVACVLSTTNDVCRLYVDGVFANSFSTTISIDAQDLFSMGQDYDQSGGVPVTSDFFDGLIDDVRIYDQALSGDIIADLAGASL